MVEKRKVDKSKKSNIKCEHCEWFVNFSIPTWCACKESKKYGQVNYWNRCKCFRWKEKYNE